MLAPAEIFWLRLPLILTYYGATIEAAAAAAAAAVATRETRKITDFS